MIDTREHSKAWQEGYTSKKPKTRNPYAAGQPWLAEFPDKTLITKCKDWYDGWECKFYGEEP